MECPTCGFKTTAVICPICKKLTKTTTWIQVIKAPVADMPVEKYSCPFCGGRRVKEIIRGVVGKQEVHYDLDKKLVYGHDGLRYLQHPEVIKTTCIICDMDLPRQDMETFFEESEEWLPQ